MDTAVFKKLYPKEYLRKYLSESVRTDGRDMISARKASLTTGSISPAVGSAMAKLGRTTVVAGVTATLVRPAPGVTRSGIISLIVNILPMAGGKSGFGSSRNADTACLSEFVRENSLRYVDLDQLCVLEEELVWKLSVTVYCLDNDGNLEDVSLFAATAALQDVRLPTIRVLEEFTEDEMDDDDGGGMQTENDVKPSSTLIADRALAVASDERTIPLKMSDYSNSVTFAILDGRALLDPSREEEMVADSLITLVLRSNGTLRAVQKPGGAPVSQDLIRSCIEHAKPQADAFVSLLRSCNPSNPIDLKET